MNVVTIMGRICQQPELRTTNSGNSVTSVTVAVDRIKDHTDFLPVVAFGKTADMICRYFSKGNRIAVTGSLQSRRYADRDGKNHNVIEIVANRVDFCESKARETNIEFTDIGDTESDFDEVDSDGNDLPF